MDEPGRISAMYGYGLERGAMVLRDKLRLRLQFEISLFVFWSSGARDLVHSGCASRDVPVSRGNVWKNKKRRRDCLWDNSDSVCIILSLRSSR